MLFLLLEMSAYAQNFSLTPVYASPDSTQILDYRYGKVLTVKQNGNSATYRLTDVGTGSSVVIPFTGNTTPVPGYPYRYIFRGWVTPYGALIQAPVTLIDPFTTPLYEYNQGTVTQLSQVTNSVSTAGAYVLWLSPDSASHGLILRNMATQQQQVVVDSSITGAAVAANGLVAYATGSNTAAYLYRYQNGVSTLTDQWVPDFPNPDYPPRFFGIQTDGERIAYLRSLDETGLGSSVYLYDHDSVTYLMTQGDYGGYSDFPIADYCVPLVNNGYVGGIYLAAPYFYHVQGQVYTRDRQGNLRYVLPIQTGSAVGIANMLNISPQGDVAVGAKSGNNYSTYIIKQDGSSVKKVADVSTRAYYEDSTWFIATDRILFSVNLDTTAHYITPITKQVYTRNRVPLTSVDFLQHYVGPASGIGQLEKIVFLTLPKRGTLSGAYNLPIYTNNAVFTRDMLDSLKYSASIFPGKDTIRWRAFDGTNWTNDTTIYINILAAPDTIKPFERNTLAGTPIRFWASNFKQNFTGKLAGIRVNRLPAYGKLTIGGKQLFYERSRDVTLAELDSMYYTPYPNIVGVDTLQWMAFNGTSYTPNDTPAILRVYPVLNTPPILRTLESQYSQAGGADTILIANYPAPQAHTDVMAVVDNAGVLPIAANHTFVIEPSAYSVGAHQLKVTFKHKLDSISIQRSFTITSPFAPMMVGSQKTGLLVENEALNVWPNPFSEQFTVNGLDANGSYTLRLYDAQGRLVLTERSFNQSRKVLLPGRNAVIKGVYVLEIYDNNSKTVIKSIKLMRF